MNQDTTPSDNARSLAELAAADEGEGAERPKGKKLSRTASRRKARQRALQAIYQQSYNPLTASELIRQFFDEVIGDDDSEMLGADADFFQAAVRACIEDVDALDAAFTPHMTMPLERLDPVERCILRLATFELKSRLDVPRRVVINEAVELAKAYGAEDGHKFINGVIDKTARDLRSQES
ncbi:MAG: transcription antitermination factor NusB [Pseudomonadota bacterium]